MNPEKLRPLQRRHPFYRIMDNYLVRMRNKASFSLSYIFDHSSAALATASSTAPRSSEHPPESRPDAQEHNTPLSLYEPYGDVREVSPTSQDVEAGQAPTQTVLRTSPRPPWRPRTRTGFWNFPLIRQTFSWFQMRLPSVYFLRVAVIIRKSGVTMGEVFPINRHGPRRYTHSIRQKRLKKKWEAFVMRCMEEWRNLNIVSALLLR